MESLVKVLNKHNLLFLFIVSFFFATGFLNYFGSVDKIAVQWLYISIVLFIFICFFFLFKKNFWQPFRPKFYNFIVAAFLSFTFISLFFSNNINESIIVLSRFIVWVSLLYFFNFIFLKFKPSFYYVCLFLSLVLFFELTYSLNTLFQIISITDFVPQYSNLLKGVTGNKNITAAIIAIKIPFVTYLLYSSRFFYQKLLISLLLFISFFLLFFISSRTSFLSLSLSVILFIAFFVYDKSGNKYSNLFFFILPVLLSYTVSNTYLSNNSSYTFSSRLASVANVSESSVGVRLRFFGQAVSQILEKPITGIGLGNWKLKSISLDKNNIVAYTVPYNVHNDILELSAEIGIIGGFFFLLIFFSPLIFNFTKIVKTKFSDFKSVVLFCAIMIYFIDLNFNFPTYRPIMQVLIIFIICLTFNHNYLNRMEHE